jgi:hypothetical protein
VIFLTFFLNVENITTYRRVATSDQVPYLLRGGILRCVDITF